MVGGGATGSDVTGSHVIGKGSDRKLPEVCSAHARFPPRFFLTRAVVQNVIK